MDDTDKNASDEHKDAGPIDDHLSVQWRFIFPNLNKIANAFYKRKKWQDKKEDDQGLQHGALGGVL